MSNQPVLTQRLLNRFDLATALEQELVTPPTGIPFRTVENALVPIANELLEYVSGQLHANAMEDKSEILLANKDKQSYRPLNRLPLLSRVRLRALTNLLATERLVPTLDRSRVAHERFKEFGIDSGSSYVVSCDVHAFYQHINHEQVCNEILSLTGDLEVVSAIKSILNGMTQAHVGLPQHCTSSDFLSEVLIESATRRLRREGLTLSRYNDDFRIWCNSYGEALDSIEILTRILAMFGLTLNERKTRVRKMETYKKWLTSLDDRWAEIAADSELEFLSIRTLYGELIAIEEPTVDDKKLAGEAAIQAIEEWRTNRKSGSDTFIYRELLKSALPILTNVNLPVSEDVLTEIWFEEPQLAPEMARFLRSRHESFVWLDKTVDKLSLPASSKQGVWRNLWLLSVVDRIKEPSGKIKDWVLSALSASSDLLKTGATIAAASHQWIDTARIGEIYHEVGIACRPEIAATAGAFLDARDPVRMSIEADSVLMSLIVKANDGALKVF